MNANIGHWMIGFVCCIEPLLFAALGAALYRRWLRRGIDRMEDSNR